MYDVAIIGAGVVGGMVARTLARYNLRICILEKENDVAAGATRANSAIVHAGFDAESGTLKAKLNVMGSEMMKRITDELDVKYINNGSVVIGFSEEDTKAIDELYKRGVKNGVKGLRIIGKNELKTLEPNISDDARLALYAPSGAIVCPYELAVAAVGNAMDNGAELKCNFEVTSIGYSDGVYKIYSRERYVSSRFVVNAAGLYADRIAAMVGDDKIKIHPRRGEYILLDRQETPLVSHTIFKTPGKMGKGILVSPTVDNNLILGPTSVDIDDKEDRSTTSEGFEKIIAEAKKYVKNIDLRKTITSFCGLRAVGNTRDFIINSPKKGFINAAGIESPGLSASPAIAVYIRDMLKSGGLELNEKPDFNPYRRSPHFFKNLSVEEKNEIIKTDKSFGRIICRCESVTEGEILYAIRQNPAPSDLDGVKRRTRAQMGRCQGGFCMPYIAELLSRELDIDFGRVTKYGGSACISTGRAKVSSTSY